MGCDLIKVLKPADVLFELDKTTPELTRFAAILLEMVQQLEQITAREDAAHVQEHGQVGQIVHAQANGFLGAQ